MEDHALSNSMAPIRVNEVVFIPPTEYIMLFDEASAQNPWNVQPAYHMPLVDSLPDPNRHRASVVPSVIASEPSVKRSFVLRLWSTLNPHRLEYKGNNDMMLEPESGMATSLCPSTYPA